MVSTVRSRYAQIGKSVSHVDVCATDKSEDETEKN